MSNAKLKEQIEAAKIALVHSAELATPAHTPQQPATVTQIDSPGNADRSAENNSVTDVAVMAVSPQPQAQPQAQAQAQALQQDGMPLSDFEILEARLQELETQIKNQQRDLHTLLQKLRDITAKSQAAAKPKKSKGAKKWLLGGVLCALGLGAVYYGPGVETITAAVYHLTGLMVALVDTLASKI